MSKHLIKLWYRCAVLILVVLGSSCDGKNQIQQRADENSEAIQHVTVYFEEGRFAGWPANQGIWRWGDEILVGFVASDYSEDAGFHTYDQNTARHTYARSLDGGLTWAIEDAFEHGQTGWGYDHDLDEEAAEPQVPLTDPVDNFLDPGFVLTFVRHNNHDGPSHFYYSEDKGEVWNGPFSFPDFGTPGVATRTDYIVEGEKELKAFLTVAKQNGREGRVAMVQTTNGGVDWDFISWIGPEPDGFNIMPSTVKLSENELLTVFRSRSADPVRDFIQAFRSDDNGETWSKISEPVADTGHYGSPPALVKLDDGRLALAYAYRSQYGSRICLRMSEDDGATWSHEIPIRSDGANADIGYPVMVQRQDGKLLIVYYWNHALDEDKTDFRYIAASIVDPDRYL
ncbi:MAG: sialidase family protein [Balneolaceae bacterium]|nr:sialidase family protein [Balneolaceae bacterium]